jgi:hypothetical protein
MIIHDNIEDIEVDGELRACLKIKFFKINDFIKMNCFWSRDRLLVNDVIFRTDKEP